MRLSRLTDDRRETVPGQIVGRQQRLGRILAGVDDLHGNRRAVGPVERRRQEEAAECLLHHPLPLPDGQLNRRATVGNRPGLHLARQIEVLHTVGAYAGGDGRQLQDTADVHICFHHIAEGSP